MPMIFMGVNTMPCAAYDLFRCSPHQHCFLGDCPDLLLTGGVIACLQAVTLTRTLGH